MITHAILVKKEIPYMVPAGVKYVLTNKGVDLVPILKNLCDWEKYMPRKKKFMSVPSAYTFKYD
ncbi:HxlR family transcriptional regulator [Myroides indicus]|uniref:HxlR family transcriptional regulator n=1 Tax=Myroides indicus TaxID=1323422 RepID=A0A4R7ES95_9FLAO|nr:HxlR family transcriptional regulator [Myroides indicus]